MAVALAASVLITASRMGAPAEVGPPPRVPPREPPVELAPEDVPIIRPLLAGGAPFGVRPAAGAPVTSVPPEGDGAGRDPFALADIWEDPPPAELPLPPELKALRVIPAVSAGSGRARAPAPPEIAALPSPVPEEEAAAAPHANPGAEGGGR